MRHVTPPPSTARALALVWASLAAAGCLLDRSIDYASAGGAGGEGAGGAEGGGGSASGAAGASTGGGGAGGQKPCGNGVLDTDELCDGELVSPGMICPDGLTKPTCSACVPVFSTCPEGCFDGDDDDGDGLVDCGDSQCAATCAGPPCDFAMPLSDPADFEGDTTGHANFVTTGCAPPTVSGSEIVHLLTPQKPLLDVWALPRGGFDPIVRVGVTCGESELCVDSFGQGTPVQGLELRWLEVSPGVPLAITVDGRGASAGKYHLHAESHDGLVPEQDDAANLQKAGAQAYVYPLGGAIQQYSDLDWYSYTLTTSGKGLLLRVLPLDDDAAHCALANVTLWLESAGGAPVFPSESYGAGGCVTVATATNLEAGTYFVRVAGSASVATWRYGLAVLELPP